MTTQDNTGGPAFPHDDRAVYTERTGMTLRDYFAAQALPLAFKYFTEGIDSKEKRFIPNDLFSLYENDSGQDIHLVAKTAYAMADAMLAARQQPTV